MMSVLKGISPTVASGGIPEMLSKPSTVNGSVKIINEDTVAVSIHPKRLLAQTK